MQIEKQTKLFAFKLAEKKEEQAKPVTQWQVREGVSVAGCSEAEYGQFRTSTQWGSDNDIYC